jgi:hypothetical protein
MGEAPTHGEARSLLVQAGDLSLVRRGSPRWLLLSCPSGCGEVISLNLDRMTGPAWRFYRRRRGVSVHPSVWLQAGCRSHFVIWNSHVDWVADEDSWLSGVAEHLSEKVLAKLGADPVGYEQLADELDEIPWDVLRACRHLVGAGLAVEGTHNQRGTFMRRG